jgi:hypothetical protein
MDEHQEWYNKKLGERCVASLKKHGFDAHLVDTAEEARKLVLAMISGYATFGFGGSATTRGLGLMEELSRQGKTIYDHLEPGLGREENLARRLSQGRCDCFLCSANAVSETGEIVNVDGVGNRTAAMTFGPKKIVIVAGINKVTPDLETALRRVWEVAGPVRARSLKMQTPCAETGVCIDCNTPQRICNVTTILHRRPILSDVSVVLVNQALGY